MKLPLFLLLAASITSAHGASVAWGNALFASSYNSDASTLEEGSNTNDVIFELGIFVDPGGGTFTPDNTNITDWSAAWRPLSPAFDYSPSNSYIAEGFSFGTQTGQIDNSVAPAGSRVYIWGYESGTKATPINPDGSANDWFLVTGIDGSDSTNTNWVVPDTANLSQANTQLTWDINNANTPIVGRIDNGTGGGAYINALPVLGPDDVQFAMVPEPSTALLGLLGALGLLIRRR